MPSTGHQSPHLRKKTKILITTSRKKRVTLAVLSVASLRRPLFLELLAFFFLALVAPFGHTQLLQ